MRALGFLLLVACSAAAQATSVGFSVSSSNRLAEIDLTTGAVTDIGPLGIPGDYEGSAISPSGQFFSVDDVGNRLVSVSLSTGAATEIGQINNGLFSSEPGLSFDNTGVLYMSDDEGNLFTVNTSTGAAMTVGSSGSNLASLAINPLTGQAFAINGDTDRLLTVNLTTAAVTDVGPLGVAVGNNDTGLSFDSAGNLFMLDQDVALYSVNVSTGTATLIAALASPSFESLAIAPDAAPVPGPSPILLAALLLLTGLWRYKATVSRLT